MARNQGLQSTVWVSLLAIISVIISLISFFLADLFTNQFDAVRAFYAESFGWEWRWVSQHPKHRYGMFYSDGDAVAGVVQEAGEKASKREPPAVA